MMGCAVLIYDVLCCAVVVLTCLQEVPGDMTDYWTTPVSYFLASPGQPGTWQPMSAKRNSHVA